MLTQILRNLHTIRPLERRGFTVRSRRFPRSQAGVLTINTYFDTEHEPEIRCEFECGYRQIYQPGLDLKFLTFSKIEVKGIGTFGLFETLETYLKVEIQFEMDQLEEVPLLPGKKGLCAKHFAETDIDWRAVEESATSVSIPIRK